MKEVDRGAVPASRAKLRSIIGPFTRHQRRQSRVERGSGWPARGLFRRTEADDMRKTRTLSSFLAIVSMALLLLSACGGGAAATSPTAAPAAPTAAAAAAAKPTTAPTTAPAAAPT